MGSELVQKCPSAVRVLVSTAQEFQCSISDGWLTGSKDHIVRKALTWICFVNIYFL